MATPDPQIEALRRVYLASGMRVRQGLLTATAGGWERARCEALLKQVEAELARLNTYVGNWETGQLSLAYTTGGGLAEERLAPLRAAAPSEVPAVFSTLPKEPLEALAREVAGRRSQFVGAILRQSQDYLRSLATGELAKGLGIGESALDVGRAIRDGSIQRLQLGQPLQRLAEGVDRACGVVYSDGSVHSLHAYGEMSARTGTLAALNEGAVQRYVGAGIHLVQVSTHQTLCFLCHGYEGKVFAVDEAGEEAGYPRLNRPGPPFHPSCRHSVAPWLVSAFGEGEKATPEFLAMSDRELYARMRDDVPGGKERMEAARKGFSNWPQYQRLKAEGQEFGPRHRQAGIESRRIEATRRVLQSGGRLSYAQAMGQVTLEGRHAAERALNTPKSPLRTPADRHSITGVRGKVRVKATNTVAETWVDMDADVATLNAGKAKREGPNYRVNGRLYGVHEGTAYPIEGPGLHKLDRGAFKALKVYNRVGLTPEAEAQLDREGILPEARGAARKAYEGEQRSRAERRPDAQQEGD